MAILVFVLSLVLLAVGLVSGYLSLDLVPTSPGLVYAFAGVVSVVGAIVVFVLGLLIVRVGRLAEAVREQAAAVASGSAAASAVAVAETKPPEYESVNERIEPAVEAEGAAAEAETESHLLAEEAGGETEESEEPLNENRAGHLPTLGEIERALETPEPPPTLIGRYSSGGANYMIFSDGTVEAETDEGAFRFASMGDFKQFLLDHNKGKT